MEKLFSLGHTVAFDWIKDRDAPPLIIQLKFQSDWDNLIGTECLHGMILFKSAFDPNHFFVRASMSIHGWVQNRKLATEIWNSRSDSQKNFHNTPGHCWCYTSEVKCLYCSVSHQCILALRHKKVGRMRQHVDFNIHLLQFFLWHAIMWCFFVYRHMLKRCSQQQWKIPFCFFKRKLEWGQLECDPSYIGGQSTLQGYVECKLWEMVRQVDNDGKWTLNAYTEAVS